MKPVILVLVILYAVNSFAQTVSPPPHDGPDLIFEGTVLRIGPSSSRVSGRSAVYQLVKYKVERVCKGSYSEEEIVIDHLILYHHQMKLLRIGEKFCVGAKRTSEIFVRNDVKGIREPSDSVTVFFIGGTVKGASTTACACPNTLFEQPTTRSPSPY